MAHLDYGQVTGRKMFEAMSRYVARAIAGALAALTPRFEQLEAAVKEFPKQGEPGKDGVDGKDADPDIVGELIAIEVSEAVAKLPKAKDGVDGATGKDGASIHPDTVALMVADQVAKAVAAIPRAKDGAPGRDALEIVPLAGIDESRSYPAGTWATYNGGEIRAARATEPVKDGDIHAAGWAVMREGIAGLVVTQGDDPREITVAAMLTGGTKAITTFEIPMVLDCGVWREGEYQKGDHVTSDGSGWIAQRKTTARPGAEFEKQAGDKDWRLSTKRGQAGKDATSRETQKREPVRLK